MTEFTIIAREKNNPANIQVLTLLGQNIAHAATMAQRMVKDGWIIVRITDTREIPGVDDEFLHYD